MFIVLHILTQLSINCYSDVNLEQLENTTVISTVY